MTRRERLMASLAGGPVDRPPVCFYEINGLDEDPSDPDPFNIHSDPSWKPLLDLARDKSDRIVMRGIPFKTDSPGPLEELTTVQTWRDEAGSLFERKVIRAGDRELTALDRRDPDINTVWHVEHLLKGTDDLRAWLALSERSSVGTPVTRRVLAADEAMYGAKTSGVTHRLADPLNSDFGSEAIADSSRYSGPDRRGAHADDVHHV